ncbi:MAG: hypothetical protein ACQEP5_00085 [Actinomycetota bacterium]
MYKCTNCGNTEKFEGIASEKGTAEITRQDHEYSWSYNISDKRWESNFTIKKCYFCKSDNIIQV